MQSVGSCASSCSRVPCDAARRRECGRRCNDRPFIRFGPRLVHRALLAGSGSLGRGRNGGDAARRRVPLCECLGWRSRPRQSALSERTRPSAVQPEQLRRQTRALKSSTIKGLELRGRERRCPARDPLCSGPDALCSSRDAVCSGPDALCSSRDAVCSSRDAVCSGRDALCSNPDAVRPPRDALSSSVGGGARGREKRRCDPGVTPRWRAAAAD